MFKKNVLTFLLKRQLVLSKTSRRILKNFYLHWNVFLVVCLCQDIECNIYIELHKKTLARFLYINSLINNYKIENIWYLVGLFLLESL